MGGKLSNSFALVKASANVLRLDKELIAFPVLSGVAAVAVAASFAAPFVVTGNWEIFSTDKGLSYTGMAYGALFYIAMYSVMFFFNAALVGAALIRLDGGDPTVSDGLAIASKRIGAILGYAVIAATVGMILRAISERGGVFARIAVGLVGLAWTLVTYLTVPVLVSKDIGPLDAVKESAAIFKRTWGEQVIGDFGLGLAIFVLVALWTLVSFPMIMAGLSFAPEAAFGAIGIAVVGYLIVIVVGSALSGIYCAALYRYATAGEVDNFDAAIMRNAFRPK
jgi:hypothetical protein